METLGWFIGTLLVIVALVVLFGLLKASIKLVPQTKRLVIYRLDRFSRIAGPGFTLVLPKIEKIEKTLEVRDHPLEVPVPGIIAYGVYNNLTLSLWCRVDLVQAANGDKEKLTKLVQMSEIERERQLQVKLRDVVANQVVELQRRMPLPKEADTLVRLMALTPGTDHYKALRQGIMTELEEALPSVGYILNTGQPIVLTGRIIPDKIIQAIERGQGRDVDSRFLRQVARELHKEFPDASHVVLAQILASLEGVDTGKLQRFLMEQGADLRTELEFEMGKERNGPNFIVKPPPARSAGQSSQATPTSSESSPRLTDYDLSILKRVPHSNHEEQVSV